MTDETVGCLCFCGALSSLISKLARCYHWLTKGDSYAAPRLVDRVICSLSESQGPWLKSANSDQDKVNGPARPILSHCSCWLVYRIQCNTSFFVESDLSEINSIRYFWMSDAPILLSMILFAFCQALFTLILFCTCLWAQTLNQQLDPVSLK